jgi:hypothetical protein
MFIGLEAGLALVVLAVVLGLTVLTVLWLRRLPRNASLASETTAAFPSPDPSPLSEAVLVVQIGGRVESMNDLAREWFGLREGELPDLERLIRRARPAEDILNLCATQGQKRLSIGGRLVDATSYQVPGPYPLMLISMRSVELSTSLDEVGADASLLRIVSDFGKNVSASLELEDTMSRTSSRRTSWRSRSGMKHRSPSSRTRSSPPAPHARCAPPFPSSAS